MSYDTTAGQRWGSSKPSYSLAAAAVTRELVEVLNPISIAPWGNAMILELEHQAEMASIGLRSVRL